MDLEDLKEAVFSKLQQLQVEELTELCAGIEITIPENKKGRKSTISGIIVKHLMSDDVEQMADEGQELFTQVDTIVEQLLAARRQEVNTEEDGATAAGGNGNTVVEESASVKREISDVNPVKPQHDVTHASQMAKGAAEMAARLRNKGSVAATTPSVQVHKIREFKINGGHVGGDEVDGVDYVSLSYQIQDGKAKGYTPSEIQGGVVRAMRAGYGLRKVFETCPTLDEKVFLEYLRSDYKVKDSATLWTELLNAVQEPTESIMGFTFRLMSLKNMVFSVSRDEGNSLDFEMIQRRFLHALRVGLNNTAVRLELQPLLHKYVGDDHELAKELSDIVARDAEHHRKVKLVKKVDVKSSVLSFMDPPEVERDDIILAEIRNLAVSVNDLATVKTDVEGLTKRMDSYDQKLENIEKAVKSGAGGGGNRGRGTFAKCENCERERKFCTHCNKCGNEGHKRKECPEN